jgi:hypothetical protein
MTTYIAQDTFVAETAEGASIRVSKGEPFPDGHPLVRLDKAGSGTLFKPMDEGDDGKSAKADAKTAARKGA